MTDAIATSTNTGAKPLPPLPQLLPGQTALVTGANSGIGEAVALAMGQAGANVAINYVTGEDAARALAAQISARLPICFRRGSRACSGRIARACGRFSAMIPSSSKTPALPICCNFTNISMAIPGVGLVPRIKPAGPGLSRC